MNILEAIKTRRVCFRQSEPTVVADLRNPVNGLAHAIVHLGAEDWEVDEERFVKDRDSAPGPSSGHDERCKPAYCQVNNT